MENVDNIKAKYIVEGANGPIDADADEILFDRALRYCPISWPMPVASRSAILNGCKIDSITAGISTAFANSLDAILSDSFEDVWQEANEHNVSLRTAAFMIAIRRVRRSTELGGF